MSSSVLSERIQRIKPSPTLAITAKAKQLKQQGVDIIGLGAGEPDFDTPLHIKQAAITALNNGQTKYTAVDGTVELKSAIQKRYKDLNLNYDLDQIVVSSGGKQGIYNLALSILDKGDEVIIPAPYWVSYPDIIKIADAEPVIIDTNAKQKYKITSEQLEKAITPNTKLFILNSPSNPSGQMYSKSELLEFAKVLKKYPNIYILTDDIYEQITWSQEKFHNIAMVSPDLLDRIIILSGVSKAYSMTGWRIGYSLGPVEIIQAMKKLQSQSTSNPCSISQAAAVEALSGEQKCVAKMVVEFKKRHDFVVEKLNSIPGIHCLESEGAFYSFFSIEELISKTDKFQNDLEFTEFLINDAKIALIPGSAFGMPNHLRLSFATSMENLQIALDRLNNAVISLGIE
tara:strand:- start:2402 stop:3601 length:1200 start_codon:yes stop_codon:yes gene_type:complete